MKVDEAKIQSIMNQAIGDIAKEDNIQFILNQSGVEALVNAAGKAMSELFRDNLDQAVLFLSSLLSQYESKNPNDYIWEEIRLFINNIDKDNHV